MANEISPLTHSPNHLRDPEGWVFLGSHVAARRLVVFVHGFRGSAIGTWGDFPFSGSSSDWVRESDMLFVGYPSTREAVAATEYRLRSQLPRFYPTPNRRALTVQDESLRVLQESERYDELVLVGHSLGGLVLRRMLCELAAEDVNSATAGHEMLSAKVRLFSPAIAGFRPSGQIGFMSSLPVAEKLLYAALRRSPAFNDLQPSSALVVNTQRRTEQLASRHPEMGALRVQIAWANPENIVVSEHYDTDPSPCAIDRKNHMNVCKPRKDYMAPLDFVELGRIS